jgi:hypothetical protein
MEVGALFFLVGMLLLLVLCWCFHENRRFFKVFEITGTSSSFFFDSAKEKILFFFKESEPVLGSLILQHLKNHHT